MHTATLLHDDVVDESDYRRGKQSARLRVGQPGERAGRRLPARPGVPHDGRGRLAARAQDPVRRRRRDRRGRGDAAGRRQEHRHHRGRVPGHHQRQDGGAVLGRRRGGRGHRQAARRASRRRSSPTGATSASPSSWSTTRSTIRATAPARQVGRRRFPRGQDHAARHPVLPPRRASDERAFWKRTLAAARSRTATSSRPSG